MFADGLGDPTLLGTSLGTSPDPSLGTWRLGAFLAALFLMATLEALAPRRARRGLRRRRWGIHLGLVVLGGLMGRLLAPVGALAAAGFAEAHGVGVFQWLPWPAWLEVAGALILLDLSVWCQHVLSHRWRWLWRLHRLHHEDVDLDATSGVRFHPLEIGVSTLWKAAVVLALGPSIEAVFAFEIVLNVASIFSHANLAIPESVDRRLRRILVTPDMHRVHHSVVFQESNRNFGFAIPAWDHWFGTYQAEPAAGQEAMELGVESS